ncbi:MAG: hypothetical protein IKW67_00880, partial [Alphaproteobacteria bacterium]|nr:hypothetical protein [Alphaproteobacteria bacterium]
GTLAGAGATVSGALKMKTDDTATSLQEILDQIKEKNKPGSTPYSKEEINKLFAEFNASYQTAVTENNAQSELDQLNKKSQKMGNWRTGLLATSTATSITGAILSSKSKADADLEASIDACKSSVENLRNAIMQARIDGLDISEANEIASACGEYEYVDLTKINSKAKGATISSSIGAATGATGTALSAVANGDKVRGDNTEEGQKKEKSMNIAATALSGTTAAASLVSAIFSGTQIKEIKKVSSVAEKCTGVLK